MPHNILSPVICANTASLGLQGYMTCLLLARHQMGVQVSRLAPSLTLQHLCCKYYYSCRAQLHLIGLAPASQQGCFRKGMKHLAGWSADAVDVVLSGFYLVNFKCIPVHVFCWFPSQCTVKVDPLELA